MPTSKNDNLSDGIGAENHGAAGSPSRRKRRPYTPPEIINLGNLARLTLASASGPGDGPLGLNPSP